MSELFDTGLEKRDDDESRQKPLTKAELDNLVRCKLCGADMAIVVSGLACTACDAQLVVPQIEDRKLSAVLRRMRQLWPELTVEKDPGEKDPLRRLGIK